MANWAKLQEQLTGLPVVKRARHSIHFDKGNGEIVANFSGKPCHYEDKGVWKPIDTGLLLAGDGWYGSPHSDVKIHKDGRVKVGGYQQKSALVAAKEGVVDGDKIVREFKFGTQYLYMKEDGFRQETVITRPPTTAEAKYLIASESGELPSKYKRSDITAVDADGAVHEFVNLGQFKKWLDAAAYPVTIDPDFVVQPDGTTGMDTYIITTPNADTNYGIVSNISVYGTNYHRALLKFDLSTLVGATITAATLELTTTNSKYSAATMYIHRILSGNSGWTELGATWNTIDGTNAWAGSAGCSTQGTDYDAATLYAADPGGDANNQTKSLSLDTTEFTTLIGANYGMLMRIATNFARKDWHSSSATTASYRPRLVVTYTTASTGVPKHFLHYARMRG